MQKKDKSNHNITSAPKNTQKCVSFERQIKKCMRDIMVLKSQFKLGWCRFKEIGVLQGFVLTLIKKLSDGRSEGNSLQCCTSATCWRNTVQLLQPQRSSRIIYSYLE